MGQVFSGLNCPYYCSVELDESKDDPPSQDSKQMEGAIGMLLTWAVWIAVFVLDLNLLINEFNDTDSEPYLLQLAAFVCFCVSAGMIIIFTLSHYTWMPSLPFASKKYGEKARMLPAFGNAIIVAGLKASNWFTILLLILAGISHERDAYKTLIAQLCLKTLGTTMTMVNQRYKAYASVQSA